MNHQQRTHTLDGWKRKTPLARKTGLQRKRTPQASKLPAKRRKTTKAAKLRRKRGEWSTKYADDVYSRYIRARDGKCLRCHTTENLTCSHYHRRGHKATRFDDENCISLCGACHAEWEGPTNEYTAFMLNLLGEKRFIALQLRAGTTKPVAEAVAEWKARYEKR